jgi:hypothetical protein
MIPFPSTYATWLYNINMRLLLYCGRTLAELPQVAPALPNWYRLGASAFMVAMGISEFLENG